MQTLARKPTKVATVAGQSESVNHFLSQQEKAQQPRHSIYSETSVCWCVCFARTPGEGSTVASSSILDVALELVSIA